MVITITWLSLPCAAATPGSQVTPSQVIPKPSYVTLNLGGGMSQDMEIILWPDGDFSVPVGAINLLLDISTQMLDEEHRLVFVDPVSKKKVEIDWGTQQVHVDDQPYSKPKHPIARVNNGFIVKDDVFVDKAVLEGILGLTFAYDSDTTTLSLTAKRKLKILAKNNTGSTGDESDTNVKTLQRPEVYRAVIEKAYISHTNNYSYQTAEQPVIIANANTHRITNNYTYSLMDNPTVGVSGSLFGQDYYVKPTFIHYNGKTNFQGIDWLFQHKTQNNIWDLGSFNAGLSPLVSPNLNLWGLKFASKNAEMPYLSSQQSETLSGKADANHQVSLQLNDRTVQSTTATDGSYEFEPLYLQPQTVNHVKILETDENHQEKVLLDQKIANFQNMLPAGQWAYSAFAGRMPLQFYPLLPNQSTPILMPESEKWLAGGRLFYGLTDRLTVGVSTAADKIWGQPRTYYTTLNPFSADLQGFSSYLRDPNYFSGESAALTMRYQLTNLWSLSTDAAISGLSLKPGNLLESPPLSVRTSARDIKDSAFAEQTPGLRGGTSDFGALSNLAKAGQVQLERNSNIFSYTLSAFRYDPHYYTPSTSIYGNTLYDKQGFGTGVSGLLSKRFSVSYNVKWDHYETNLERLIAGGYINANHWTGGLTSPIGKRSNVSLNGNWTYGDNRDKQFIQRSLDLIFQTQILPWHIKGEVRASRYFTNTILLPSQTLTPELIQEPYKNNSVEVAFDIPLLKIKQNHFKIGNYVSTYVDYGFFQGYFQWKHYFCEPVIQISYGDKPQTQNRLGIKLGYEFKSGAKFSVGYYKIFNTFGGVLSLPQSTIKTDQFYMDFSDVFGLFAHKLQSLGPNADGVSRIAGRIYADYNQNNQWDKNEPGIPQVHLMVDKQTLITTDQHGYYTINNLSQGYHTLEILAEHLPFTLNSDNPVYRLKVIPGKTHILNMALTPAGGTLKGNITLQNIQGKQTKPTSIILVLMNQHTHQAVNYTSPDPQGHYKFGNLPPGQYIVDIEQKIKTSGKYKILHAPSTVELKIPPNYEETSEIKGLDFSLLIL